MEDFYLESFGHGNYESEVPGQQSPTPFGNDPNFSLKRQKPVFSVTQDEFPSMREMSSEFVNAEDLMNGGWDVEANETSLDMNQNDMMMVNLETLENSFPLPITLPSQTSMNEVWVDIQRNQYSANNANINNITYSSQGVNVLGQVKFEDYLVKEGIIQAEDLDALGKEEKHCLNGCKNCPRIETSFDLATIRGDLMLGVKFPHPNSVISIPFYYLLPPRSEIYIPTRAPMFQATPPRGSFLGNFSNIIGRGNQIHLNGLGQSLKTSAVNGVLAHAAERRKHRMIKIRQSAARSRARKQVPFFSIVIILICIVI
ncbi:uncharacterized protein LOC127812802 [Diospyros lotus]|uniref:uncharacterized protein LOC127812802 n=1 Tax=Diospyros lotus TaxID=55363 RepID=UPI002251A8EC|nr:uncharacterized protein LOC127812802 [Diospyros lotus]